MIALSTTSLVEVVAPVPAGDPEVDSGRMGGWCGMALTLVAATLSVVSVGGALVQYLYPLVVVVMAVVFLVRHYWYSYLAFTIITWLAASEVRRFADWHSGYHTNSLVSITPSLVSLVALPWVLSARRPIRRHVAMFFGVVFTALLWGAVVGVVKNGIAAAAVDVLYLAAPATTGLFVAVVPSRQVPVSVILGRFAAYGCLLMGGYALVQFLVLPPWDAKWILDSGISTIGGADAGSFRAFGTLSTTGPLGQVLAALLLVLVADRRLGRYFPHMVVGLLALGVTLVRAGWIGLFIGSVTLLVLGRRRVGRLGAVAFAGALLAVAVGGPIVVRVQARITNTASSGTADTSLQARLAFQRQIAPEALSDPVGLGFGSTGRATHLGSSSGTAVDFQNFDSGIFENLIRYGAVAGLLLLLALVLVAVSAVIKARRGSALEASCAAAIVALTTGIIFTDTLRAVYGLVLMTLIGFVGRPELAGTVGRVRSQRAGQLVGAAPHHAEGPPRSPVVTTTAR